MFEQYFGLRENPFGAGHQPRFIFPSQEHQEAIAHLRYGIENREAFLLITGEVGTGKTTAIYNALDEWGRGVVVALITNSSLTRTELLEEISLRFGVPLAPGSSKPQALAQLESFLVAVKRRGDIAILLLDEAQNLGRDLLEEIRLLSNQETQGEKLLQIFLVGQPELETKLASPELRQLRQRIAVHYRLWPLTEEETEGYIHHRISVAGGNAMRVFPADACREVYRLTHGIPREVNNVAGRAMLNAFVEDSPSVLPRHVVAVESESDFKSVISGAARPQPPPSPTPAPPTPTLTPTPARVPTAPPPVASTSPPIPTPPTRPLMPTSTPIPTPPTRPLMPTSTPIPTPPLMPTSTPIPTPPPPASEPSRPEAPAPPSPWVGMETRPDPMRPSRAPAPPAPAPPTPARPSAGRPDASVASSAPVSKPEPRTLAPIHPMRPPVSIDDTSVLPARLREKLSTKIPISSGAPRWVLAVAAAAVILGAIMLWQRFSGSIGRESASPSSQTRTSARAGEPASATTPSPPSSTDSIPASVPAARDTQPPAPSPPEPESHPLAASPAPRGGAVATASSPARRPAARAKTIAARSDSAARHRVAATTSPAQFISFGVAVGSYLTEERAGAERTKLAGGTPLPARILTVQDGGVAMYRLVLGAFPDRVAAETAASDLIASGLVNEARVIPLGRRATPRP